jgi:uncharacterized protein YndB with AHSA1/START domain
VADAPGAGRGDPGIDITWVFDAPREDVWREWTEPEAFADWYGGPDMHVPHETVAMDVRAGGRWSLVMRGMGREIHWNGEYIEVEPPERLAFTVSDRPGEDLYDLCTVVLRDLGDGRTEMHFTQTGSQPAEVYRRAGEGWSGFFARIAERLAASNPTKETE